MHSRRNRVYECGIDKGEASVPESIQANTNVLQRQDRAMQSVYEADLTQFVHKSIEHLETGSLAPTRRIPW